MGVGLAEDFGDCLGDLWDWKNVEMMMRMRMMRESEEEGGGMRSDWFGCRGGALFNGND